MDLLRLLAPVVIGSCFVCVMSLVGDDRRRRWINAAVTVGASGTYIATGTFGPWELLASTVVFVVAFQGFRSWRWIGVAWLLHTGLDAAHASRGVELLPWAPHSALGCAICDPVIAIWCFAGGRRITQLVRRRRSPGPTSVGTP